jgi:hypothetical protein
MLIPVNNGVAAETVLLRSVLPVDPVRLMLVLPPDTRLSLWEACSQAFATWVKLQAVELLIALWLTVMVDKSFPVTVYFLSCCLGSQRVNKPLQSPLGGLLKHTLSGDQ